MNDSSASRATTKPSMVVELAPSPRLPESSRPVPGWIVAVRARTPKGVCVACGESIGAARLTLHPGAPFCAWCAPRLPGSITQTHVLAPPRAH